jgi:hypothetical protein
MRRLVGRSISVGENRKSLWHTGQKRTAGLRRPTRHQLGTAPQTSVGLERVDNFVLFISRRLGYGSNFGTRRRGMASLIFWQRTATRDFRERERLVWGSLGTERGVLATKKRNIIWGFGFFFVICYSLFGSSGRPVLLIPLGLCLFWFGIWVRISSPGLWAQPHVVDILLGVYGRYLISDGMSWCTGIWCQGMQRG